MVISEANRRLLHSRGVVIYLVTTIKQQVDRTRRDTKRPLLQNVDDPEAKLRSLMEERETLYQEIADHMVMTNRRSAKMISKEIVSLIHGAE